MATPNLIFLFTLSLVAWGLLSRVTSYAACEQHINAYLSRVSGLNQQMDVYVQSAQWRIHHDGSLIGISYVGNLRSTQYPPL